MLPRNLVLNVSPLSTISRSVYRSFFGPYAFVFPEKRLESREDTIVLRQFLFFSRDFRRFISGHSRRNHGDLIACFSFFTISLFKFLRLVPYNRMPRPRIFCANDKDAGYIVTTLPRRPPSPVRHVLPGRFDLRSRTEELLKRQSIAKARRYLWEFKDRISQSVKQVSNADVDFDLIICMLVLRGLCEQVILTMAGTNIGIDIHTFVNMAIVWTLCDLQILDPVTLNEQECAMSIELGLFDNDKRPESRKVVVPSKLQRSLFKVHRSKFGPQILTHLHRCLPWSLVSPTHQREIVKFYPNVRERIDELLPDSFHHVKTAYIPDVTCFHFREVPDKTYVAHKRKSKSLRGQERIDREYDDEPFVQLVNFV